MAVERNWMLGCFYGQLNILLRRGQGWRQFEIVQLSQTRCSKSRIALMYDAATSLQQKALRSRALATYKVFEQN